MTYQKLELELGTDINQSKTQEQTPTNHVAKKENEHLEQLLKTKNKLKQIKDNLNKIIDSVEHNQSLLARAAVYWHDLPVWKKIIAGVVLTLPLLAIGILANLAALITLSIVMTIVYTASSILLDNHQNHNKDHLDSLKAGISSLADLLNEVIESLSLIREQLALDLDKLHQEVSRLTAHIDELGKQISTLTLQINHLTDTEYALRATQIELEALTQTLKGSIDEQSQLLETTQKELDQVVLDYKLNQIQLSAKVNELDEIKVQMGLEVKQAQSIGLVLNETVKLLTDSVIEDKEQRGAFQKRLDEFLANKEQSFDHIVERICNAERKLAHVTDELSQSNQRYSELLDQQELLIARLERMVNAHPEEIQEPSSPIEPSINGLSHGFFAIRKEPSFMKEQTHRIEITV